MKYTAIFSLSVIMVGCSSKVQTNPMPNQSKINVPNNYTATKNGKINEIVKKDFDDYAKLILLNKNADADSVIDYKERSFANLEYDKVANPNKYIKRNNIWQTGLDISNRELKKLEGKKGK